jgi:predicted nucleic acid-binding protein
MTAAPPGGQPTPPAPVISDASVWVAFFLTADVTNAASFAWIDQHHAAGGMLVAPAILLTEVAAAISRRLGPATGPPLALQAAATLARLPLLRIVPMDEALVTTATDLAARLGLRGADALYVAAAQHLGLPLLTWDREQLTRPAGLIHAFHP